MAEIHGKIANAFVIYMNPKFRLQLQLALTDYSFDYTPLPPIFTYESLKKVFSQIKQRSGEDS